MGSWARCAAAAVRVRVVAQVCPGWGGGGCRAERDRGGEGVVGGP